MMPIFWEYLITTDDGPTIRLVAEKERDSTEKELESDARLIRYCAKPQVQLAVTHQPSPRVLRRLRRMHIRLRKLEVNHMHDFVVTINNTHWPAYQKENGTLVDLRLFDPNNRSPKPMLIFRPDALRESGIPEALIEAAAQSNPPGLILFEDVPQFKGCDDQPNN